MDKMREALERSNNHLKYQYETDKQRMMRSSSYEHAGYITGLNSLASVIKQNEEALSSNNRSDDDVIQK